MVIFQQRTSRAVLTGKNTTGQYYCEPDLEIEFSSNSISRSGTGLSVIEISTLMAFRTPIVNTDVYKGSFFHQTIRDWNALPDSLILSAEDAEDCVAKFTSLVRGARWLSGRVSDSGARGPGFETYRRRVVSLSKTLYSPKVLVNYPGSDGSVPT